MMRIITFLSDFGDKDWFVAAVKGEILKIINDVFIVDITHELNPYDIYSAAFLLKSVYNNFPSGTIHLCVIDPGVGSRRKPIIVESGGYFFVGPDNGIFSYVYDRDRKVYEIKVEGTLSSTFHAREIFGPTAARLAKGLKPQQLGYRVKRFVKFEFPKIKKKKGKIYGEVIYIDHFGNLITNIPNSISISAFFISKRKIFVRGFYGEGDPYEIIGVKGSSGFYEIARNQGSASELLQAKLGMHVWAFVQSHRKV